jgi:hypothetical protein
MIKIDKELLLQALINKLSFSNFLQRAQVNINLDFSTK